ncbi:MAG: aspartate kinase [Rikenellaceae bacterium]
MKKTLKFGGTSVGSATNMRCVAQIIVSEGSNLTVLSAMSGTTDALEKLGKTGERDEALVLLRSKYGQCIEELLSQKEAALERMEQSLEIIATSPSQKEILAQGELLTTFIFTQYLTEQGIKAELIHAPDFMNTDDQGLVETQRLALLKERCSDSETHYVTQGFICTNSQGQLDNLGRGGSDYSAALMGVAIDSKEVQIWTDIDGMHTGDPRFVEGTRTIRRMSFDEAAELAYFGAKILHPSTIQPCKAAGVDVRLKDTMHPEAEGTLIGNSDESAMSFHAVAAKDNITVVRITSERMLMAYGFLRRVFEVFEKYQTPIDMITTSEVAVSLTVDNTAHLDAICEELRDMATVEIEQNNTIVCIVGRINHEQVGLAARIFKAIENVPVKMISYGASHRSLVMLISTENKITTLQSLNDFLF